MSQPHTPYPSAPTAGDIFSWDPAVAGHRHFFVDFGSRDSYEDMMEHSGVEPECSECETRHPHSPDGPECAAFQRRRRDLQRAGTYAGIGPVLPRDIASWLESSVPETLHSALSHNPPPLSQDTAATVHASAAGFESRRGAASPGFEPRGTLSQELVELQLTAPVEPGAQPSDPAREPTGDFMAATIAMLQQQDQLENDPCDSPPQEPVYSRPGSGL